MNKVVLSLLVLVFLCLGASAYAATPVRVDVLYMNHGR